ncbi:hypothetical protein CDD83_3839 [Cordyceps sp. RAO-2017]|nr:hypothetical protein CDD83_3839 [Cordyceps sp. RAO-2017]
MLAALTAGRGKYRRLEAAVDTQVAGFESEPDKEASATRVVRRGGLVVLGLLLSLAIGFLLGYGTGCLANKTRSLSPYLRLDYRQDEVLHWTTEYSNLEAGQQRLDELWDTQVGWEQGIIALENDEARAMGLPESQPFPWDGRRKSIYIVNAHHLLHCVRNIYISIQQYRTNRTQTISYAHILHCLDSLRVETMCSADDTPRYVPLNSAHGFRPGDGQQRSCRDWSEVQAFVQAHDPCYRYVHPGDKDASNLQRFMFCPPDSEYLPKIRKYFQLADSWTPEPQQGWRELGGTMRP